MALIESHHVYPRQLMVIGVVLWLGPPYLTSKIRDMKTLTTLILGLSSLVCFGDTIPHVLMMPIELTYFEAEYKAGVVELSWATASEQNNEYFTVEKTLDGISWQIVAIIPGAGNSSELIHYRTSVASSHHNGERYYRLTQTDYNGEFESFPVIAVNFTDTPSPIVLRVDILGRSGSRSSIQLIRRADGSCKKVMVIQ